MTPSVPVTIVGGGEGGDLEAAKQGFSDKPGSEFMALGVFLMCSASLTLLLYQSTSRSTHADSFHCILCPVFHTCVAMALFGSAFNTAFLCSSILSLSPRGRTSAPFVEYPSCDGVWVAICLEYSRQVVQFLCEAISCAKPFCP